LVDVVGGLVSLVSLALFLKVWRPREKWRVPRGGGGAGGEEGGKAADPPIPSHHFRSFTPKSSVPVEAKTGLVAIWGCAPVQKEAVKPKGVNVAVPGLHERGGRGPAVTDRPDEKEKAVFVFNWLSATGTGILFAAILSAVWLRVSARQFLTVLVRTCARMR